MKKIIVLVILFTTIFIYACSPKIDQTITVTFETNGGSLIDDIVINKSLEFALPNDPIKEGYTFAGWYLDNDTFEIEFIDSIIDNNITLYAKWMEEEIVYDLAIFFESNGGSIVDPIAKDEGEDISQPIAPTREGYEFAGWYGDIDLTLIYEFNVMPSESISLYADWGTIGLEYELINDDTEYSVSKGMASQLTEIQIPNRKEGRLVTNVAQFGFYECRDLEYITISNTIKEIGREAFRNCINLKSVEVPKGVLKIETLTFANCNNMMSIAIPESVTYIEKLAFWGCDSLETLVIPKSVTNIEENVLIGCSSLKTLTIPFVGASRDSIGADALLDIFLVK